MEPVKNANGDLNGQKSDQNESTGVQNESLGTNEEVDPISENVPNESSFQTNDGTSVDKLTEMEENEPESDNSRRNITDFKEMKEFLQKLDCELRAQIKKLGDRIEKLEEENKMLRQMLNDKTSKTCRKNQNKTIYLYSKRQDDLMKMIERDLKHWLDLRLKHVTVIPCDNVDIREPTSPLLVLCINTSRAAKDAINAVKNIADLENAALVIFHHKDAHALKSVSSRGALSESPCAALNNRIYDLGFLQEKGIYHCDFNYKALTDIATFLKKFG